MHSYYVWKALASFPAPVLSACHAGTVKMAILSLPAFLLDKDAFLKDKENGLQTGGIGSILEPDSSLGHCT